MKKVLAFLIFFSENYKISLSFNFLSFVGKIWILSLMIGMISFLFFYRHWSVRLWVLCIKYLNSFRRTRTQVLAPRAASLHSWPAQEWFLNDSKNKFYLRNDISNLNFLFIFAKIPPLIRLSKIFSKIELVN